MPRGADDRAPRPVAEDLGGRNAAMPTQEERRAKLMSLVDVLEPLSEEELRMLARRCPDISVRDGEEFYRPEQHDGGLFLVLEGSVRLHLTAPSGKETILDLLGSGTTLSVPRRHALAGRPGSAPSGRD